MNQADRWFYPDAGAPYTIVECPRRDCDVQAKEFDYENGPWTLLPAFLSVLDGEEPRRRNQEFQTRALLRSRVGLLDAMLAWDARADHEGYNFDQLPGLAEQIEVVARTIVEWQAAEEAKAKTL